MDKPDPSSTQPDATPPSTPSAADSSPPPEAVASSSTAAPPPPEPPPPSSSESGGASAAGNLPKLEPKLVSAARGWQWVLQGFALFRPYPAFWVLLLLFYIFLMLMVRLVPVLGPILLVMLVPTISAGYMVACHAANHKLPPLPAQLFIPLRHNTRQQVALGLAYLTCMTVLMMVSRLIGGEVLFRIAPEGMAAIEMRTGGLVALALYTPVMLAFWFAPSLCFWGGVGAGKALFFSFFASWRNRNAFLVYSAGWLLFGAVIPMVAGALLGAVLPAGPSVATFAVFLMLPYMIAVACAIMVSFYASYVDVFGAPPAPKLQSVKAR